MPSHTKVPPRINTIVVKSLILASCSFVSNAEENERFRRTTSYDAVGETAREHRWDTNVSKTKGLKTKRMEWMV